MICFAPVIPPHEPISGCAMSIALFSKSYLNPNRVCSFSPPAIGMSNLDLNSA